MKSTKKRSSFSMQETDEAEEETELAPEEVDPPLVTASSSI